MLVTLAFSSNRLKAAPEVILGAATLLSKGIYMCTFNPRAQLLAGCERFSNFVLGHVETIGSIYTVSKMDGKNRTGPG